MRLAFELADLGKYTSIPSVGGHLSNPLKVLHCTKGRRRRKLSFCFPACPLELGHLSSLQLHSDLYHWFLWFLGLWTWTKLHTDCFPVCQWQIMELLSLHNHFSAIYPISQNSREKKQTIYIHMKLYIIYIYEIIYIIYIYEISK